MGIDDIDKLINSQKTEEHPFLKGLVSGLSYEQSEEETLPVSITNLGKFCYKKWALNGKKRRK